MRPTYVLFLAIGFVYLSLSGPLAQEQPLAFGSSRWTMLDPGGRIMPYLGRESLYLERGIAIVPDANFSDGTIEFDIAIHGNPGFAGVVFRGQSPDAYELIYLRTNRSRQWDALQYTPIFAGQEAWQLYAGEGYNGSAELPANRWVHVRLIVDGFSAQVFVDGAAQPQLHVADLKRPWARGFVGLWGRAGAANFSNVRVSTQMRSAPSRPVPIAITGVITRWALSPSLDASVTSPDRFSEEQMKESRWEPVSTEASGILNIAQHRRKVAAVPRDTRESARDVVFAKTVLYSPTAQRVRLEFGYSDDVTIFLNGRPLFSGHAAFLQRDGSFLGTLTFDDAIFLDLVAGRNELTFAVAETFGGWGLAARLASSANVTLER